MTIAVSGITSTAADGSGSMTATDTNGDTLTAMVDGTFSFVPVGVSGLGAVFFDGTLSSVVFNDNSGDGAFNGDVSSFSTDFSGTGLSSFAGALQRLQIGNVGFFDQSFSGQLAEVDGQIVVPGPAGAGLLVLAGLVAGRRRR